MKVLTLHQPWASLIAVGAKTIETRSWRTDYRGPLAIHAALTVPVPASRYDYGPRPCVGEWKVTRLREPTGEEWAIERKHPDNKPGLIERRALPLGAVVASATLIDCVPIDPEHIRAHSYVRGWQEHETGRPWRTYEFDRAEVPFGDFSPGRFAWLLGDVAATTQRCPWCWGRGDNGVVDVGIDRGTNLLARNEVKVFVEHHVCPVCEGRGRCDPVPARGRQGLWEWTP